MIGEKMTEFPVVIYGNLETFNDVCSKARCRIFYKGKNRNGTYITEDFARKLISTLHYVPVKGIFDDPDDDFTDHGEVRSQGRIYGIVPETNNFAWEKHLDKDGVEREYACTDVLLFTALYQEANDIVGKSQSMELFPPSLKYHYEIIEGQKYVVFDEGSFLGLQVLGDEVEPCFEGAAFYSLQQSIESIVQKIEQYAQDYQNIQGGQNTMVLNFKLSDDEKFRAIWSLLNENYNEEGEWAITYGINAVYDEYALVVNYETGDMERVYYTKDDETDSLVINKKKKCFVVDITEEEKETLDTLRKLNGDTYEFVAENLQNADDNAEKVSEFNTKILEMEETISTLKTEKEESATEFANIQQELNSANEDLEKLKTYKHNIETEQKKAVISEYEDQLSEEIIESYTTKIDEFTTTELDKELAYELKKANPNAFSKAPQYVPKDVQKEGIDAILAKYVR